MSRETVNSICKALPGAEWSDPWGGGHDAWKVGGKMFACIGSVQDGVSVNTPSIEDAELLIDMGRAIKAPYFHKSWIRIDWDGIPKEELQDRIKTSYRLVRASLPKKVQATLGSC